MASSPPYQVEDQTDADFFDNLVNDDVDFNVTATTSSMASGAAGFADGNDSDEVKAFANLNINETKSSEKEEDDFGIDDSCGQSGIQPNGEVKEVVANEVKGSGSVDDASDEKKTAATDGVSNENIGVLNSSDSFEFRTVAEMKSGNVGVEAANVIQSSGSGALGGVKEVQWSAFTSDSAQKDGSGFGSYSDFFTELSENADDSNKNAVDNFGFENKAIAGNELHESAGFGNLGLGENQDINNSGAVVQQSTGEQDVNSSQYWESLYPGWKFDPSTGQWYQVDGYDAGAYVQGNVESDSAFNWAVSNGKTEVSYLQQTVHSVAGTVPENATTESVTNWNQVSQHDDATGNISAWNQVVQESGTSGSTSDWNQTSSLNNGYPAHMVFDPQYPGWYYDTIAQEWRVLDSYESSLQSTVQAQDEQKQNGVASTDTASPNNNQQTVDGYAQVGNYSSQGQDYNWSGSFGNYNKQVSSMWQPGTASKMESPSDFSQEQQLESEYGQNFSGTNHANHHMSNDHGFYEKANPNNFSTIVSSHSFVPSGNFGQQYNQQGAVAQKEHNLAATDYYRNQNSVNLPQQFHGSNQFSYSPASGLSSAGRPPHALVTFGFGGKLIVATENNSIGASSFGSQSPVGSSISILNLMEVVTTNAGAPGFDSSASNYFDALCQQSLPGPLTSGSASTKDLNRWIDERISNTQSPDVDYMKTDVLKLLLSLLKISCQYYGKLRSSYGSDPSWENDVPEAAIARLFASAKRQFNEYGAVVPCLQKLPSEGQMRATAAEVQSLLVSGRKKEALQCALEGQLWGPALVLAAQLGDQFYVDTVKQMALRQLVPGSPLRTLCLLIAGQPHDVFGIGASSNSSTSGAGNTLQQPAQFGANGMLDDWEENLAVITANRTKDDELVLIHLGDCMWKEKNDVVAAHICYLIAEANFEPYSNAARMCLLGANHWRFPRTYASPEAIQRTEIYEYSKVQGNSQFILLPFQPYKLLYAHMLAEVGRISDALKYCQSVQKSLKTGRAPEVETLKQLASSLEERIRTHQQGGFSTNLAPAKLVGKLLNLFDSTAHRVVGSLPPPVPSTSGSGLHGYEQNQQMGPRVLASQSTMAMSSLIPSASMEPISEWASDGNRMTVHNRSVSEPDFGRSPRQAQIDSSKEASTTNPQGEVSGAGTSRFGRFGFGSQLLQKTVGLVLRPRQGRQAKLGEKNKFYYDEKLKRWVEEGAEPPAEETALPPPPTTATFENGTSDYNLKTALKSEGTLSNGSSDFKSPTMDSSGVPPLPPVSNQFSARARMGIRSRYVDTFNQGGGNQANLFQSPSIPPIKPAVNGNPKFFVPTPVSSVEERIDDTSSNLQDASSNNESTSSSNISDTFQSPVPPPLSTRQRFGSMGHIPSKVISANSRRTASWSGSFDVNSGTLNQAEAKPLGDVLGVSPSAYMPNEYSLHSSASAGSFGDDLHEVEL